jgi:hypothetical protein
MIMHAAQWTTEQKMAALMRMPWTVLVETDPTDASLIARVAELPDAIATGTDETDLARDLWEAIEASLRCRLDFGDEIQLPAGINPPWEQSHPQLAKMFSLAAEIDLNEAAWQPISTSSGQVPQPA